MIKRIKLRIKLMQCRDAGRKQNKAAVATAQVQHWWAAKQ